MKKGKLTGKAKSDFLKRMAKGRKKTVTKKPKSVRKQLVKRTKSVKVKRKSVARKTNNMAKRKRFTRARKTGGKIFGNPMLKKAMIGIGASTLAGVALNMFAPQLTPIAKPIAGFMTGGIVGGVASVLVSGEGLSGIGSIFGGNTGNQGLSV